MSSARAVACPNPSASHLRRPLSKRDSRPARSATTVPATVIHKTATSARRRWQAARLIGQRYTEAYVRTPGRSGPRVVHPTTATTTARATCAAPAAVLRRNIGGRVVVDLARIGQVAVHRARLVGMAGYVGVWQVWLTSQRDRWWYAWWRLGTDPEWSLRS